MRCDFSTYWVRCQATSSFPPRRTQRYFAGRIPDPGRICDSAARLANDEEVSILLKEVRGYQVSLTLGRKPHYVAVNLKV